MPRWLWRSRSLTSIPPWRRAGTLCRRPPEHGARDERLRQRTFHPPRPPPPRPRRALTHPPPWGGAQATDMGALQYWVNVHERHHLHCEDAAGRDPHSPRHLGFWRVQVCDDSASPQRESSGSVRRSSARAVGGQRGSRFHVTLDVAPPARPHDGSRPRMTRGTTLGRLRPTNNATNDHWSTPAARPSARDSQTPPPPRASPPPPRPARRRRLRRGAMDDLPPRGRGCSWGSGCTTRPR